MSKNTAAALAQAREKRMKLEERYKELSGKLPMGVSSVSRGILATTADAGRGILASIGNKFQNLAARGREAQLESELKAIMELEEANDKLASEVNGNRNLQHT